MNLNDPEEMHYLKCTVALETASPLAAKKVETQVVPIRNAIILFLSNLTVAETRGSANKEHIQGTIAQRIEQITGPAVKKAYLTEFVVQ